MSELKTLATCKPTEFLKQTVKIKRAVQEWLTATDIIAIIKKVAPQELCPQDATDVEKMAIASKNMDARRKQIAKNISDAFDVAMEEHPEETLKILALCCFIEPEKADDYKVSYYLQAFNSLISDKATIDFFISLAQVGQMNTSDVSKA
jgi:hypothetical protein